MLIMKPPKAPRQASMKQAKGDHVKKALSPVKVQGSAGEDAVSPAKKLSAFGDAVAHLVGKSVAQPGLCTAVLLCIWYSFRT